MTGASAVFHMMALGWIPMKPGEKLTPGPENEQRQCGSCLRWLPCVLKNISPFKGRKWEQWIALCDDCRAGRPVEVVVAGPVLAAASSPGRKTLSGRSFSSLYRHPASCNGRACKVVC